MIHSHILRILFINEDGIKILRVSTPTVDAKGQSG